MSASLAGYAEDAIALRTAYERLNPDDLYAPIKSFLPEAGETVLDIGAGTGRDTVFWQKRGCHATAVEPVADMWAHPSVPFVCDRLPKLDKISETNLTFDVITVFAVWHHLTLAERNDAHRALGKLSVLGGRLLVNFRHGPSAQNRPAWPINVDEEADRLTSLCFDEVFRTTSTSHQRSNQVSGVTWTWLCLRKSAH